MKKIHILYTIPNFDTAGSGKVVYDLASKIDTTKFRVSIACSHNRGAFFKEIEKLGHPIHIIATKVSLKPYYKLFFNVKPFKDFLKEKEIDIVHSWDWSSNWSEVLACKLAGVTYVYTKKAMSWGNKHWKIKSYLSNYIITVNNDMQAFFPNKKNQKLIPFGLDTAYYNPQLFTKSTAETKFKIITVANLVPVKGIEVLIKALKQVNSAIVLDVVGDTRDPYAATLKKITTDLNLQDRVSFLGKLPDVRSLLNNADLYVICSKKEGMPMALVEAMSMGIPVLGADVPGIRYVLKEFKNLLFTPSNSEALASKIETMYALAPNERIQLGASLRAYCVSNFNINTFIANHEKLYQDISTTV